MPVNETFARRLKRLREAQGFSVAALAERCGVPAAEIHDLEAGRVQEPELIVGLRLAEALSVDVYFLAMGEAGVLLGRIDALEKRMTLLEWQR